MSGIARTNNPNWRGHLGRPAPKCVCGHVENLHELVGNKGCHATLNQPTEYHPGPCLSCDCKTFTAKQPSG